MLDLLFRASQASGAEGDRLAADVTKNAGALMEMGMSLEESVALFALFEREGIRSETVVRSLRSAFQRLTEDGRPLRDALADVFDELQTLDREAAVAKGLEIFGTQALDLVDAVRDGRLSVEDFTKQLMDGEGTIIGVAGETDGWREKLDELRNNLKLLFEPAAREVFAAVVGFVETLIPAAERVAKAFDEDGLQGALRQVAEEWDKIYADLIEPLFLRLLAFLENTIKPKAIEIGLAIGSDLAAAIGNAVSKWFSENWPGIVKSIAAKINPILALVGQVERLDTAGLLPQFDYTGPTLPRTSPPPRSGPITLYDLVTPFATGGIVSSPTLGLVGEAGPEAIIPLDRMSGMGGDTSVINVSGALDAEGVARQIERILRDSQRRTGGVFV